MDAVLNWLWQGCVVALSLFVMLRLLERGRANARYVVCWAALLLLVSLPAVPWLIPSGLRGDALGLASPDAIVSVPHAWWTSGVVMVAAWSMWASVYTVRFLCAIVALRRARARSRAFPTEVESVLPHWRRVRNEGRRPTLVLSDAVTSAAVLGCGAPSIAVAPSLVTMLEADELDRVLIHEWAHVQRRDDLVNLLQVVVRIVAGWHPAVWWIDRRLQVEREIACDEMTVAVTGSPKSYAACLVKLASLKGTERTALAAPAVLRASGLRARINRIVSRHVLVAPLWSFGVAAAILSALCLVSVGVGGLRLVEATVLELPFDSLRAIGAGLEGIAPVAMPSVAPHVEFALAPRETVTPTEPRHSEAEVAPPVTSAAADSGQPTSVLGNADYSTEPPVPAEDGTITEAAAEPQAVAAAPPFPLPHSVVEGSRSLWSAAADGGTAIGRESKEAGVATAGFFTRFARGIAGSF